MRSRVVPAVLLIALSFPAFCRTSGVNSVTGVPNDVLYHFFFNRVMWLQDQADKMLAQGKGDGAFRDLIRQQAGLTSQQESALNAIAADWRTNDAAILRQIQALAATGARGPTSPQLQALHSQRQQLVLSHLSQLQTAFGAVSFYLLDLFVHRTVKVTGPGVTPAGN